MAGGANNQLLEERHGEALEAKGILYAPDYVANAGGVINVYSELAGWTRERSLRKADEIYDTLLGRVRAGARATNPHVRRCRPDGGASIEGSRLARSHVAAVSTEGVTNRELGTGNCGN